MELGQFTKAAQEAITQFKRKHTVDLSKLSDLLVTNDQGETVALVDLVLEGGGAKGIAHVGALYTLESLGIRWRKVAGTSAGAIVASLIGCHRGCLTEAKSLELLRIVSEMDMNLFLDGGKDAHFAISAVNAGRQTNKLVNLAAKALGMLRNFREIKRDLGINPGKNFKAVLKSYLAEGEQDYCFIIRDLIKLQEDKATNLHRLNPSLTKSSLTPEVQLVTFDITHYRKAVLPRELDYYLHESDHVDLLDLTRCSISIPFVFAPARLTEFASGDSSKSKVDDAVFIDGGIVENLPISIFDCANGERPVCPTLGLLIDEGEAPGKGNEINSASAYVTQIMLGLVHQQVDKLSNDIAGGRVIAIPATGPDGNMVSAVDFDMGDEIKLHLFMNGVNAALSMVSQFNFANYPRRKSPAVLEAMA